MCIESLRTSLALNFILRVEGSFVAPIIIVVAAASLCAYRLTRERGMFIYAAEPFVIGTAGVAKDIFRIIINSRRDIHHASRRDLLGRSLINKARSQRFVKKRVEHFGLDRAWILERRLKSSHTQSPSEQNRAFSHLLVS